MDEPTSSSLKLAENEETVVEEYGETSAPTLYIETPYYYQENGSTIIYGPPYDELPQQVLQEEIVEHTYEEPAPTRPHRTNKSMLIKEKTAAGTVLLTPHSLSAETASFLSRKGRKPKPENAPEIRKINKNGSSLNQNLPDMSNMFKVVSESALSKADIFLKAGRNDEELVEEEEKEEERREEEEDLEDEERSPPPMEKIGVDGAEFTNGHYDQWPLYNNSAIDFKEACEILIGIQQIDEQKVCKSLPLQFKHEATFLIDTRCVRDMSNDHNGPWEIPSGKTRYYKENEEGNLIRADDGKGRLKEWTTDFTYKIQLKRYDNRVTKNSGEDRGQFQRKIYTGFKGNERIGYAIITYSWFSGRAWNFVPPVSKKELKRINWEKRSCEKVDMTSMPEMVSAFYDGFNIYSCCTISFDEACSIMLGATVVDNNKICPSVPLGYRQNGTFVIDLKRMGHCLLELRRDDNGIWSKPSGFSRFYKFADNGDAIRIDKLGKLPAGRDFDVKVSSKRYEHLQVDKKFVRKIYTAKGKDSETFPGSPDFAVIVYYWKGDPIPFEPDFKQNVVRSGAKTYSRYQQIEEVEDQFVETTEPPEEVLEEEQIVCEPLEAPPPVKRGRFQTDNVLEMKINLIRREMDNQDRFSAVLDRTEALLSRMEQRMGVIDVYAAENVQEVWNEEEIIEEEVIHDPGVY